MVKNNASRGPSDGFPNSVDNFIRSNDDTDNNNQGGRGIRKSKNILKLMDVNTYNFIRDNIGTINNNCSGLHTGMKNVKRLKSKSGNPNSNIYKSSFILHNQPQYFRDPRSRTSTFFQESAIFHRDKSWQTYLGFVHQISKT